MIRKLCTHPGCNRFRLEGHSVCEKHLGDEESKEQRKREYFERKYHHTQSKYTDLYATREWKELRKKVIEQHPYCAECGSKFGLQVHHNYASGVDYSSPDMFFNPDALEVLCTSCHSKETDRRRK